MKMSPYFSDLSSSYGYEIEDLTYDSAGDDVLDARLRDKRKQFKELLAMGDSFPVMVVPALRGAFRFGERAVLERLICAEPGSFPAWEAVEGVVQIEPWAAPLVETALANPGGDQFMLIAAGLEYIFSGVASKGSAPIDEAEERPGASGDEDEGEEDSSDDLAEAGEEYLSEQGFDRRS